MEPAPTPAAEALARYIIAAESIVITEDDSAVRPEAIRAIHTALPTTEERRYVESAVWTHIFTTRECFVGIRLVMYDFNDTFHPSVPLGASAFESFMNNLGHWQKRHLSHVDILEYFDPDGVRAWLLKPGQPRGLVGHVAICYRDRMAEQEEPLDPGCPDDARILAMCQN